MAENKKRKIMDKDYDVATGVATLKFLDGQVIEVNLSALNADIQRQAALHGLLQKIGDAAAGHGDDPAAAFEACMGVYERVTTGEWDKKREAGEARPSMVVEAVFRVLSAAGKVSNDDEGRKLIMAKYTGEGSEAKRKQALTNPDVKLAFEQIKLENAQKKVAELQAKQGGATDGAATLDTL
jgi:hypothetical protein